LIFREKIISFSCVLLQRMWYYYIRMKNNIKSTKKSNKKNVVVRAYIGQEVLKAAGPYIIAQVAPGKACLISTINGNRWKDFVDVNDISCITKRELKKIGVDFMLDVLPEAWGM